MTFLYGTLRRYVEAFLQRVVPERPVMRDFKANFDLTIRGGEADERGVTADDLGQILRGIFRDVAGVCRNASAGDSAPWAVRERSSKVYVVGEIRRGNCVIAKCEVGDAASSWGADSAELYFQGVAELRESDPRTADLPEGFDRDILQRIASYQEILRPGHSQLLITPESVEPPRPVVFDATLYTKVHAKLLMLPEEDEDAQAGPRNPEFIVGYEVQGILYELSDRHYDDPQGMITFEVDAVDDHWTCTIAKDDLTHQLKPHGVKLEDLFREPVVVIGDALFRKRKPTLAVRSIRPLTGRDPAAALDRLAEIAAGMEGDLSLQELIDEARTRE